MVLGESSRENQTLRPKPQTLNYIYSLSTGKFWGHFTGPCPDVSGRTSHSLHTLHSSYVSREPLKPLGPSLLGPTLSTIRN